MFNSIVYWLGAKGCLAVGIVATMITSDSTCSYDQTWHVGFVLLGCAALSVAYLVLRGRGSSY